MEKMLTNNSTHKSLRYTCQQTWKKILPVTLRIQMKNSTTFLKYSNSLDHNAPLIKLSRKLTKLASKPWVTEGLLNSIKTKNKLYKKSYE